MSAKREMGWLLRLVRLLPSYARIRVFFLKRLQRIFSNLLHTFGSKCSRWSMRDKFINNSFKDVNSELGVNDGFAKIDASNRNTHGSLFCDELCLGNFVPRFIIFFR